MISVYNMVYSFMLYDIIHVHVHLVAGMCSSFHDTPIVLPFFSCGLYIGIEYGWNEFGLGCGRWTG